MKKIRQNALLKATIPWIPSKNHNPLNAMTCVPEINRQQTKNMHVQYSSMTTRPLAQRSLIHTPTLTKAQVTNTPLLMCPRCLPDSSTLSNPLSHRSSSQIKPPSLLSSRASKQASMPSRERTFLSDHLFIPCLLPSTK
jgi:hypothetical protein